MSQCSRRGATGRSGRTTARASAILRPRCEPLEGRLLLANKSWVGLGTAWINPLNWSPLGSPTRGDTLIFGSDYTFFRTTINDLSDGPYAIRFDISGYDLQGGGIGITGSSAIRAEQAAGNDTIGLDLAVLNDSTIDVGTSGASLTIDGRISGAPALAKTGPGALIVTNPANSFVGTTTVTGGLLRVDGGLGPVAVQGGGTLGGIGTVGAIDATSGGTIAPGNGPGILSSGSVALGPGSTFAVEIDGTTVGTGYDRLAATGSVSLGGAALSVGLGFGPRFADRFTILENNGTDPVVGRFAGLPQGALFTIDGTTLRIDYFGGDGNDVVLSIPGPPVARDDVYSLPSGSTLAIPAPGVLLNDTPDPNGNRIAPVLAAGPMHGTLNLFDDGSFNYTPAPGFAGQDAFTYYDTDGVLDSNTATVTLFVNASLLPPVTRDDSFSGSADASLTVASPGVLGNDYSPDGLPLSAEILNNASHGTVTLAADGSFTYVPTAGFVGLDSFTYRARDSNGLGSGANPPATVTIAIAQPNRPPVAVDDSYTANEDAVLVVSAPGVLLNDLDPDGDPLSAVIATAPLHGTVALGGAGAFSYTPFPGYSGPDSFTYRVGDGKLFGGPATVDIAVRPVAAAPVARDDAYTAIKGTSLVVAPPGLLLNDTDPNGTPLAVVVINGPFHASAFAAGDDGGFVYTPVASFRGTDSFSYYLQSGTFTSNPATVTITVLATDQPPVAADDSFAIQSNQRLVVPAPGILGNDSDPEGQPLAAVLVNPPLNGTLQFGGDGSFVYTPNPGFGGLDSFTYRASDGTQTSNLATVAISVAAVASPSVELDPSSDTGTSTTDRVTRDNTPTFLGTAFPDTLLVLYARPEGGSAEPIEVGRTTTDAAGHFAVTSRAVADGSYRFSIAAFRGDGLSSGPIDAGPLLVDTVGPRVTYAALNPRTGQVYVTFRDDRSGMGQATLANLGNYSLTRKTVPNPRQYVISGARPLAGGGGTAPQSVLLASAGGRKIPHGRYQFAIVATGVTDVAGNALDGEFRGTLPSGDGVPGTDFNAQFLVGNRSLRGASPTSKFVPVVTRKPVRAKGTRADHRMPRGPHASAR